MTTQTYDWLSYAARIGECTSADTLAGIDHELFGRKAGLLTIALKELGTLPAEERRRKAVELNEAKRTLSEAIALRHKTLGNPSGEQLKSEDGIDSSMELPPLSPGHLHLIPEFIRNVEEVFGRMGFDVMTGPEIETEDLNFNLLNIPPEHPARDAQDTFWIQQPATSNQKFVLRTHTSPVQIRYMQSHTPPFRAIFPGKVYRKDADATHSPMFHQFEGLMIGKDINLANMKAVMITAIRELIDKTAEFRFRTGYFPFVEPGLEVDMRWQGEESESREGKWLEIVGCGLVHPNVLKNCNIDADQWQGFAFGFGIERMIMIKHRIPDLRSFYEGDLRFLKQF
ncbi:MAG: phenylalanyl-tRNA synthetase, alpha subunit [Candidatus Peregrinibacteria bacterium Greene0416_62]|nr:MAG: phenylalanyl-tRNA synthetase, alpha subunit [Candidatus Peregrinibacteria bacterium Greene0416_62]TSC99416.1 MAG: phenylalanyl-tRNA synthetase, alpha subunit [Candidatus Peregrinibacteria bacterium Greene1014_49]